MKIKIKDSIYDANEEPIMLIFENRDSVVQHASNLQRMGDNNSLKYCICPDKMKNDDIKKFMK